MAAVILNNLKSICDSKRIDKHKLSEMTGICAGSISKYINKNNCSIIRAIKIAMLLNVELDELMGVEISTPKITEYNTPCRNQACLLNKDGICINDVVLTGRADCAGKYLIKDKPKRPNYKSTTGVVVHSKINYSRKEGKYEI